MKKLFLILFIGLLACSFFGCEIPPPPCKATKIQRPALSADALKWVQVADTAPYFKVTSYDVSGNITSVDTLQGHYTDTIINKNNFGDTDCTTVYYQEASIFLDLKQDEKAIGAGLVIDNYKNDKGFDGKLLSKSFNETTDLDTALINGKIYNNVLKRKYISSSDLFFYAKEIGYILMKDSNSFSGKTVIIELIL